VPEAMRFDRAEVRFDRAERLDNGWLRVPATVGRTGVLEYEGPNGSVRREYRPPEEVFHQDALRSAEMVPVTNGHPPEALDATNTRFFAVGWSSSNPRVDGKVIAQDLLITDAAAIRAATEGKIQISPGYRVDYDPTPGVTPDGQRYDGIQRKPRINHYAMVWLGRQGPEVLMRMDEADAFEVPSNPPTAGKEKHAMKTIRIDEKDHEVADEVAAAFATHEAALAAARKDAAARADAAPDISKMQARIDALEEERRTDRASEQARIDARVSLVANARRIAGDDYRADGKSDLDVMRDVILAIDASAKDRLEQRKDDRGYIEGRYEVALERAEERKDSGARLLAAAQQAKGGGAPKSKYDEERERFDKERTEAWKPETRAG